MPVFSIFSSFSAVWILDPDAQTALGSFGRTRGRCGLVMRLVSLLPNSRRSTAIQELMSGGTALSHKPTVSTNPHRGSRMPSG
jgi:hypothetical protein